MMKSKLLHLILVVFFAVLVSACGNEPCKEDCDENGEHCKKNCGGDQFQCIEADDWGYPKLWIPAAKEDIIEHFKGIIEYEQDATEQERQDLQDEVAEGVVTGAYPNQSAKAIDSKQVLIDADNIPLVITIGDSNQWTSWFGGEINTTSDGKKDPYGWDGGQEVPNLECIYQVTNGNSPSPEEASSGTSVFRNDLSPAVIWSDRTIENNPTAEKRLFYIGDDNNFFVLNDKDDLDKRNSSSPSNFTETDNIALYANEITPCYFRYGMGLYVGLASNNKIVDPTDDDVIFTYHIPDSKIAGTPSSEDFAYTSALYTQSYESETEAYTKIDEDASTNRENRGLDGYLVRGYASDELPGSMSDDRLFFKVIDNYYDDNSGGYQVKIKEGTRSNVGGPLETVTKFIIDPVKSLMKTLYEGIIANEEFITFVRALLVLYIAFYGYKWMIGIGSRDDLRKDAVIRMFKVGVIATLIGPESWNFFYNNLFAAFTEGVLNISALLMSPFSDYDPQEPWYSMDSLLAKFFSPETFAKISSVLFSNFPTGIFYMLILYFCMGVFIFALIKAVVLYLVAFIGMGILIALAPIFIVLILFDTTKSLFQEWWQQMVTFSFQVLLLMTALGMFSTLITTYMERTLGYKVCWSVYADFDFIGVNEDISPDMHITDFRYWMPDISTDMANIWMDVDDDGVKTLNPPEMAFRYVDLPYFDPIFDRDQIAKYMTEEDFLEMSDILIVLLVILLMLSFMDFIKVLSATLKGGAPGGSSALAMDSANSFISSVGASAGQALNFASTRFVKPILNPIGQAIQASIRKTQMEAKAKRKAVAESAKSKTGGSAIKDGRTTNGETGRSRANTSTTATGGKPKVVTSGVIIDPDDPAQVVTGRSTTHAVNEPVLDLNNNSIGSTTLFSTAVGAGTLSMADDMTRHAREKVAKKNQTREEKRKEAVDKVRRQDLNDILSRLKTAQKLSVADRRTFAQAILNGSESNKQKIARVFKRFNFKPTLTNDSLTDLQLYNAIGSYMDSEDYDKLPDSKKEQFESAMRGIEIRIDKAILKLENEEKKQEVGNSTANINHGGESSAPAKDILSDNVTRNQTQLQNLPVDQEQEKKNKQAAEAADAAKKEEARLKISQEKASLDNQIFVLHLMIQETLDPNKKYDLNRLLDKLQLKRAQY